MKTDKDLEKMRKAGVLVRKVLNAVEEMVQPGITTGELNAQAEKLIAEANAIPLFKGVENPRADFPFPAALCTSVNEEIVHGIPGNRVLKDGDVVSVDCGVRLDGWCGDSAITVPVGKIRSEIQDLLDVTRETLDIAIYDMKAGRMWSEVAFRMQRFVESAGYSVVRDFVGHGIGKSMHEDPQVPNYWERGGRARDFELTPGLVIAVEPMVNLGGYETCSGNDSWTVLTRDGKCSAHFEHTIAITESGPRVMTAG